MEMDGFGGGKGTADAAEGLLDGIGEPLAQTADYKRKKWRPSHPQNQWVLPFSNRSFAGESVWRNDVNAAHRREAEKGSTPGNWNSCDAPPSKPKPGPPNADSIDRRI